MNVYSPEKDVINNKFNKLSDLVNANRYKKVVSCKVIKCNEDCGVEVKVGKFTGTISASDLEYSKDKIKRYDAIKLVGHYIKAIITDVRKDETGISIKLSRALCQEMCKEEFISKLKPGQVIPAYVDGIESYGLFCDIGCGITALLPTFNLCTIPIIDAKKQLNGLNKLYVIVKSIDSETGKIILSHKELLGTFDDEIENIKPGETVLGTVINKTDFGVFISIGQNLKGVADLDDRFSGLEGGDKVSVYIKNITRNKMKVRLTIIDLIEHKSKEPITFNYYIKDGVIDTWKYSPDICDKEVKTIF